MKAKWMIIPAMALLMGCTREMDNDKTAFISGEFSLYAASGEPDTKTVLEQDGNILWSPADCINVYYGDASGKFTSVNTEPAAHSRFTGSLGSFYLDGQTPFVAVYPYSDGNTYSEEILKLHLPSDQTGVEGSFADDLYICVAKSTDYNLHFYNVCGGVKFSLVRDDIKKIVFRGNNGELLAGDLSVRIGADQIPFIASTNNVPHIENGATAITLTAPDGGTFKAGTWYYLVAVPVALKKGYTMELYSDGLAETLSSDASVTIRRSVWGVLNHMGTKPEIEVTPAPLDFGTVPYRSSLTKDLTIKNTGYGKLTFTIENVTGPFSVETNGDGSPKSYSLDTGESVQIPFTYTPSGSSSNDKGSCTILSNATRPSVTVTLSGSGTAPSTGTVEYVDLGLSVMWATCNLGASSPEAFGDYYTWGETEPYYTFGHSQDDPCETWRDGKSAGYDWGAYKWCNGASHTLTKYNTQSARGTVDNKTVLDPEDDAAHVLLGGNWRMPTKEEISELQDSKYCKWAWTTENGVMGYRITSKVSGYEGNSIFLPAAGYRAYEYFYPSEGDMDMFYWSSSLSETVSYKAITLTSDFERCTGLPVRAVYDNAAQRPKITVSPSSLDFGSVPVGSSSSKNVTVTNVGTGTLTFTIENVSAPFSVPTNGNGTAKSYSLSAGQSVQVPFTFTPVSASSSSSGSCSIVSNAMEGKVSVSYTGTGVSQGSGPATMEYVDLGLSVKWATCNIGASVPEEEGDFYAWGETETYYQSLFPLTWKTGKGEGYANASYSYSDANEKMTKYCISSYEGKDGFVDNKTVLDPEDDVAHVKLGGSWRMPTIAEVEELWSKCSNVWVTVNGVGGFRLTGPNGNTIFLPQTRSIVLGELQDSDGYGSIWSSSLDTSVSSFAKVYVYSVSSRFTNSMPRYLGYAVRPVYAE